MNPSGSSTPDRSHESHIAGTILIGSLGLSLILSGIMLWKLNRSWTMVVLAFLVSIVLLSSLKGRLADTRAWARWMLALAVVNFVVVVPELALRAVDFTYVSGFKGGFGFTAVGGRPVRLIPDPKLIYKVSPADTEVNALGFPYREVSIPKRPRTYRILYLGDSCTQQGYPQYVEFFLNMDKPQEERRFESVNLALNGYSSHQGRVLAEEYGQRLDPDLVVVYFGWNDHWRAYQAPNAERVVDAPMSRPEKALDFVQQRVRLLQGMSKMRAIVTGSGETKRLNEFQVPAPMYRQNLLTIKSVFDQRRTPVIFITAPTSFYRLGVPDRLTFERDFVVDREQLIPTHRHYNQIVRDLARETGAYVLDLESELAELENPHTVFLDDGIHFQREGLFLVARRLTDFIERVVLPGTPSAAATVTH